MIAALQQIFYNLFKLEKAVNTSDLLVSILFVIF